jgi:Fe-S cluster assembly protein SufD
MKQLILDLTEKDQKIEIKEDTEIFGIFIGTDKDKIETNLDIIHNKPQLNSEILIKAALFDRSQFKITGNLVINRGSKKTDTYLKISTLMLSKSARATAIPSLEISETDVKGGHGATVGQVDRDQLFYLKSRGLSESDAQSLLVKGFLRDVTNRINDEDLKKEIDQKIAQAVEKFE